MVLQYEKFRNNIINYINDSGLDIGAIAYVFRDIYREIESTYQSQLNKEITEENEKYEKLQEAPLEDNEDEVVEEATEND